MARLIGSVLRNLKTGNTSVLFILMNCGDVPEIVGEVAEYDVYGRQLEKVIEMVCMKGDLQFRGNWTARVCGKLFFETSIKNCSA